MCQIPQTAPSCIRPGWLCRPTGTWGQRKGGVWPWRKELALDSSRARGQLPLYRLPVCVFCGLPRPSYPNPSKEAGDPQLLQRI